MDSKPYYKCTKNKNKRINQKLIDLAYEKNDSDNEADFSSILKKQKQRDSFSKEKLVVALDSLGTSLLSQKIGIKNANKGREEMNQRKDNIQITTNQPNSKNKSLLSLFDKKINLKREKNPVKENNIQTSFTENNIVASVPEGFYHWLSEKTHSLRGMAKLHQEIIDFYNFIKPTSEEDILREISIKSFKLFIKKHWPNWKVKIFGSFPNKLHLPNSDVDVLILTKTEKLGKIKNELEILKQIEIKLKENEMVDYLQIIEAQVPIISTCLTQTKINLDICVNRKNGYEARKVMKRILADFPFLRPLIYLLKYFLRQRKLNESYTGGVSSFLLFNLLFSFIQYLFKDDIPIEKLTLGDILVRFFQFYRYEFNYIELGISIRDGGKYYLKEEKFSSSSKSCISVENFMDPGQDVGHNSHNFKEVRKSFEFAIDKLYYPTKFPLVSYLEMIIIKDEFLVNRYKRLTEYNGKLN